MYELMGKRVKGRFGFPSGVISTNADTAIWMINNIPEIGFYVGKSTTYDPKAGNPEDILSQPLKDSFWNAVGYTNPGIEETLKEFVIVRKNVTNDVFLMPQIGESSPESFQKSAKQFDMIKKCIDGLELNLSCPHADKGGILCGSDPDYAAKIVKAVKNVTELPIFVKFNAGVANYLDVIKSCDKAGADAFSGINTLGGPNPELSNTFGGLSGAAIYSVTKETIQNVRKITNKPMIVMGGIRGAKQIRELDHIDSTFFYAIGSALAGKSSDAIVTYFATLSIDLNQATDVSSHITINKQMMEYKPFVVKSVHNLSRELRIIHFYQNLDAKTGQFVFLKVGNKQAKPFSVADDRDGLELVVRKVGDVTSAIFDLKPNNVVRIRGPYGKAFNFKENESVVFVGAGCGIGPIFHAAHHHDGPKYFVIGAKNSDELVYLDQFMKMGMTVYSTDDGSVGIKGFITDALKFFMNQNPTLQCSFYNCGPEIALKALDKIEREFSKPSNIYHLVERMTSCGVGICGKCSIPNGKRACIDGPVFEATEFKPGDYTRNKYGVRVKL
jgi:dihydroorotate dehydrogenase (NAD+) catalytic subunit